MCGIVGYCGNSNAIDPIIEGLRRLEYRGYDSAGISIQNNNQLQIIKKEGKLANLENLLKEQKNLSSTLGIGHTRWATHGAVNDTNAHPHGNTEFSIVHNGIVENANIIREKLQAEGHHFNSETDTETFLVLLTAEYQKVSNIQQAILNAFKQVTGNSAFVIIHRSEHKIYSIKKSAPLVCGINESTGEVLVSSDPYALVGFTTKIFFPEDNILCVGDHRSAGELFKFYDLEGRPSQAYKIQKKQMDLNIVSKGPYEHFMLKEIFEQPALVKKLYSIYKEGHGLEVLKTITLNKPEFTHIIGCGTALHAGLVIKSFFENINSIRTQTDFASEFRYRNPLLKSNELGLFISQSGETADTLACQEMCQEKELTTLGVVNVEGSTLFRNCDKSALLHAGVEIGVASTKAFTQMVLVGYLISKSYEGLVEAEETAKEFENLAAAISLVLNQEEAIKQVAKDIYNYKGFIFTGRREQYPIALEGALKLKEIAYVHAEGYASGELKHGPIALFDESMVNIAIVTNDLFEKTISNAQEVKARLGVMVILGEDHNKELEAISDFYIPVNYHGLKELKPVVSNVVLQLLSYHIAKFKGTDIDKPRNLAKSVTVE